MRQFIRHPTELHIDILTTKARANTVGQLSNLSYGGICGHIEKFVPCGTHVLIHMPTIATEYEGHGISAWCRRVDAHDYEIGISFDDENDAFNYRMVEQICLIEQYRKKVSRDESRSIDSDQAAVEPPNRNNSEDSIALRICPEKVFALKGWCHRKNY